MSFRVRAIGVCLSVVLAIASANAWCQPVPSGVSTVAPMLEKALPSVVHIRTRGTDDLEQSPFYAHPILGRYAKEIAGISAQKKQFSSSGSGVVIDAGRGLIITNVHVIDRADEIKVYLYDGREFPATLLGRDSATDVAVVKITATGLVSMPVADSSKVKVGDFVFAIGNPFSFDFTATRGMVSNLMRSTVGWKSRATSSTTRASTPATREERSSTSAVS
jgi:serine protease DegQ